MDAIEVAIKVAFEATDMYAEDGASTEESVRLGALYAAIAQAEQLKRIADALSNMDNSALCIAKAIHSNNQYN